MKHSIEADAGDPLILLLAAPRAELVAEARGLAQRQLFIGLGILGVTLGLVWMAARRISRPLEDRPDRSGRSAGETSIWRCRIWNPVNGFPESEWIQPGSTGQFKGHIEERAARIAEEQRQARELDIARQIQQSMLPPPLREPLDGRYAIAATLRPAREVGGDLYDFFLLR